MDTVAITEHLQLGILEECMHHIPLTVHVGYSLLFGCCICKVIYNYTI